MISDSEITKRAAEGIMGWHYWDCLSGDYTGPTPMFTQFGNQECMFYSDQEDPVRVFDPLTDWRAAGEVVEKMRADGWYLHVESGPKMIDGQWIRVVQVRWGKNKQFGAFTSPEFPRAITIAALLACKLITEAELS